MQTSRILKICKLIDAAKEPHGENMRYVPVDVSESALVAASMDLINKYPKLKVRGIVADYTRHMNMIPNGSSKLIIFFGSSIGNFSEAESQFFLRTVANSMRHGDRFLIGLDMIKQKTVLEAAYNDSQGVTSEFNKNVLHVRERASGDALAGKPEDLGCDKGFESIGTVRSR
jgi:L-histidine N-alpha-methyltransferase